MGSSSTLASQIKALAKNVQSEPLDDASRAEALAAAEVLVGELKPPIQRIIHDVSLLPPSLMAIRMGVQLGVYDLVSQSPAAGCSPAEVADHSGADVILVNQIMMMLESIGYLRQDEPGRYKPSALTTSMADPTVAGMARSCFDLGTASAIKAPEFFRKNNNQFPRSSKDTPFQLAFDTELGYFEWMGHNPEFGKDFQQFMTISQRASLNWYQWFDIQGQLVDGFKTGPDEVLLIDIGGGEGTNLLDVKAGLPNVPGRFISQDLPHVVTNTAAPDGIELLPYDFFMPQPVKGARAYFFHWVLHDWSDKECRSILVNTVEAMEPGYSRLVIHETILPDINCPYQIAAVSVMMMAQVAAFERTEKQWRDLLRSVGLTKVTFYQPPGMGEGIIEAII